MVLEIINQREVNVNEEESNQLEKELQVYIHSTTLSVTQASPGLEFALKSRELKLNT